MHRKIVALACLSTFLIASPAFAYKRDTSAASQQQTEETQGAKQAEVQSTSDSEWGSTESGGRGLETAGYVFLIVGGAAAIAGSTIIAGTDKDLTGAIVGGSGAALSVAGSLMILFGSRSNYALAPSIDPEHNSYGVKFAANF